MAHQFHRKTRSSSRKFRLVLEALDARDLPGSLTVGAAPVVAGEQRAPIGANQAPVITDFRAIVGPDGQVAFLGRVSDDQFVAGDVVHIVGAGVDCSAIVRRDGTFLVTTTVSGSEDITVVATVTDSQGATSNPVYTIFTPSN